MNYSRRGYWRIALDEIRSRGVDRSLFVELMAGIEAFCSEEIDNLRCVRSLLLGETLEPEQIVRAAKTIAARPELVLRGDGHKEEMALERAEERGTV